MKSVPVSAAVLLTLVLLIIISGCTNGAINKGRRVSHKVLKWRKKLTSFNNKNLLKSKFQPPQWRPSLLARFNQVPYNQESFQTPPQVLAGRGYPVETHYVTTDDGYILDLYRIPARVRGKRAVFMLHGVFESAGTWLVNPSSRSLPCLLSDLGYDVWLGNMRGTRYGRAHVNLDPNGAAFWEFSWDDVGEFDVKASINYILTVTGQPKLTYVGHSMGSAVFFISMIKNPELNEKIEAMIGLAPLSSFAHFKNVIRYLSPFVNQIQAFLKLIGTRAFFDNEGLARRAMRLVCEQTYTQAAFCWLLFNSVVGKNFFNFDLNLLPVVDSNFAMGTSTNVVAQFAQNYNAGEVFQAYDYGRKGNIRRYGTKRPPLYDLSKVTAPVNQVIQSWSSDNGPLIPTKCLTLKQVDVFYGSKDDVVAPQDVEWLLTQLGNVKYSNKISGYNHADFIWGTDVKEKCYNQVIAILPPP